MGTSPRAKLTSSSTGAAGLPAAPRRITAAAVWSAAICLAMLGIAAAALVEFALAYRATDQLSLLANAALSEATLPGATRYSVEQSVRRAMAREQINCAELKVEVLINGQRRTATFQRLASHKDHVAIRVRASLPDKPPGLLDWCGLSRSSGLQRVSCAAIVP